ncbi:glycosyltransferase family 4 protein [Candidatus Falkowbacteria bacterium]|nr:glycosyltransferase family 4 protein [Candidatus Falkowbacteria bacterium]
MKKIGIDLRSLLTTHYSGIPEYVLNMVRMLQSLHDVTLQGWYNQRKHAQLPADLVNKIPLTIGTTPNKILNARLTTTTSQLFDAAFIGCDVVWMPDINFWSPLRNKKLVVTVHDVSYLRFPEFFSYKSRIWTTLCKAQQLLKSADHLIAVSNATKQDCVEILGIDPVKISVVHEGVDTTLTTPASPTEISRVKTKYNLPNEFILFVGTLEPRKNIESVIRAAQFVNMPLVIAGKLGWKYRSILKAMKQSTTPVQYLGYIPKEDKAGLYAQAKVFLWPSFYEGFGLPVLEAQSQGVPVITSATSSLGEITNGSAVLVHPYQQSQINHALARLLEDSAWYATLQQAGKNNASRFSWQKSAQETLDVLRSHL